ncbi:MAG: type II toxin-antitoxin system prevent-host-death family antitoxin [Akkermansiaceae bacterium]|jgi:prevent-host-death family protein|nr:type II toxin-antitoxin system prevent-host-death family antitoxin [Akkermansiaceae bacterium]
METTTMGAFDAKNHFSELLEKALQGRETIVTKHGHPVAKIVPYTETDRPAEDVFASIASTRTQIAQRGDIRDKGESWKDVARKGLR